MALDLIWNLHPVEKIVNSRKNNFIPSIKYLNQFSSLQYSFSRFLVKEIMINGIENYCILLKCTKDDFLQLREKRFQDLMANFYIPQMEIASNMGFETNWSLN